MDSDRPSRPELQSLLQHGEVLSHELVPRGSNYVFVVEISDGASLGCRAVYKPARGEASLWDFPPQSLYKREYLAHQVSEALGLGMVPLTVIRDGPYGVGSVQLFIEAQPGRHYFNLLSSYKAEMVRIAVLDCLINNADRKAGHCMIDNDGCIWAIDHGLAFLPGSKLRTVMWELCDEPVPQDLRSRFAALQEDAALRAVLSLHLGGSEVRAFYQRVEEVLSSPEVPIVRYSDPWRPHPWPTI